MPESDPTRLRNLGPEQPPAIPEPPGAREDGIRTLLRAERARRRAMAPRAPPAPVTLSLRLMCSAGGVRDPVGINQRTVTLARHGMPADIDIIGPGEVCLFFNRDICEPAALEGCCVEKLERATVSGGDSVYPATLEVATPLRDGGGQAAKVLFKHPQRPDEWLPLKLVPGDKVTTLTLSYN